MSGEKDLEQLKREAAEKAKAAALAKRKAKESGDVEMKPEAPSSEAPKPVEPKTEETPAADTPQAPASGNEDADLAKKKAAAAAKAKAAAAAKRKAMEQAGGNAPASDEAPAEEADSTANSGSDTDDLAKKKAAAVAKAKAAAAKAKAAAAAKAKAAGAGTETPAAGSDDEKAKAIAAAKAKAKAAAAAKAKAAAGGKAGDASAATAETAAPSANQPYLDKYVKVIAENLGDDVLEDSYINKLSKDVPTLVAKRDTYYKLAQFLKYNELLGFDYLSELHGTDFETHMEVYVHLYSYKNRQSVALKVKIDRDEPTIESLQPIWAGANWPECEAYDLLGIKFTGHPNLHRIMLGEDWVGHPLRKDYEQYDVEV